MAVSDPAAVATSSISRALTAVRAASERGDADALGELLAPHVVFHSPFTSRIRFEGREEVVALHRDIFAVLDDLETADPLTLGDTGSFSFRARVRGMELEAIALVRVDQRGHVTDFKVYTRPLPSLGALFAVLPPRVSARRRGRRWGALVALLTRPLAFALRTADRFAPRFV